MLLAMFFLPRTSTAAELPREQVEFFEKKVRPILVDHCHSCHSQAGNKKKGGLTLDTLAGFLKGGDTGAALVPGQPDKSLVIKAVRHTDDELKMPPKNKLTDEQVGTLTQWVKLGAPWPGASGNVRQPGKITDEDRQWWAFQPVRVPAVPDVGNGWAVNPIDRFLFQKLTAEGLKPSPPAERQALVRRLYFDLVGLPPTPAEMDAALGDKSAEWYERLVEKLLASPRYGERWARHWLDLVRYAESDGFRIDDYRPDAWRYRDYVIRSFNADKPYDRFVREQLAGDELWPDDPEALTATGFLRHWIYEYNQRDVRTQWNNILDDVTDVTGDVFLGLGMGCARCHDHKFDPILQKDYYRLRAFFAPIQPRDDVPLATAKQIAEHREKLAKWEAQTTELRKEIEAIEGPARVKSADGAINKFPDDIQAMIRKPIPQRTPLEHQLAELAYRQVLYEFVRLEGKLKADEKEKLTLLKRQLIAFNSQKPEPLPMGLTVSDAGPTAPPTLIPKKAKLPPIDPGYLTLLEEKPATVTALSNSTGRRSELARWLTRPENPLTTRVIVNRIWQHHFGMGLVATSSDFGRLGEKPSHPELLDWLAARFVQDGWSFKQMHRLILNSAAYRQSATHPAPAVAVKKDPENRLLWRMATRRLDAEQIRDAILSATGELDLTPGGPALGAEKPRRTIFTRVSRNTRDPLLDVFDAPEGFTSAGERNVTTTPTQSLLLINSPYMLSRARAMGERLKTHASDNERIDAAYRLTFNRLPSDDERRAVTKFLHDQMKRLDSKEFAGKGFQAEKMPYREGRAAVMQPGSSQVRFLVPDNNSLPTADFTMEAFVQLRSLYDDASVRTIVSHWGGEKKAPGWSLGVTSKKSAFKPQTLVLQLFGDAAKHGTDYDAIFSGLHIALNKPYFIAVSVHLGDKEKQGITFYAKDLSNDEEPMQVARCAHKMTSLPKPGVPFAIGGHGGKETHTWDGLIDDVRLSSTVLRQDQLLLSAEGATDKTVGYWQFEAKPGVYKDSSSRGNHIQTKAGMGDPDLDPRTAALVDLCHVLLNANEFLYVD
ncbi:MAG: DUF1553 domain-containing protein [Gemmataceae bacterium]|nr:DUF1553 domain-containing protein [Gemmataceae bacterium]